MSDYSSFFNLNINAYNGHFQIKKDLSNLDTIE